VTAGGPRAAPPAERFARWLPVVLVPVALLGDLGAAIPVRTYFFRDFTATFFPLRLFAAGEVREGRLPFWNPYVFEGSFQLPSLYPPDLLLALWPSPVFASWLLTLHLPLAALGAYWLTRELGASRAGGIAAGAAFALGGLALSSLNLYVFLQALALAPFVAGLMRRAALGGARPAVCAAGVLALALSTLAVEFVLQALVLGLALGAAARPTLAGARRLAVATLLGTGLAGLPVAITLGLLPETARGAGFAREVALGNAVHPAVLLQALLPHLFGVPSAPAEAWWGGRFFSKGLPYFLTLHLGPTTLALAALGAGGLPRRTRAILLGFGALGLWHALGEPAGLAALVSRLPLAGAFRFPSKALLLPYLAIAVCAGHGIDRLRGGGPEWTRLLGWLWGAAGLATGVAALVVAAPRGLVAWTGVAGGYWPLVAAVTRGDAAGVLAFVAAASAIALAVRRGLLRAAAGAALLTALLVADLSRAGAGFNRQVQPSFFELLPEVAALPLRDPEGGRVFSYGLDHSPAFQAFLARGGRDLTLAGTFLHRQVLGPYANVLDRIETPEATDLTAFAPRPRELAPSLYAPEEVGRLLPWLRNAAVSRVVSLDPLSAAGLVPLGTAAPGPPGLAIRAYAVEDPWPRALVACRVRDEPDPEQALLVPYGAGFDPRSDVVLSAASPARCQRGRARRVARTPGEERYEVALDGDGYLVTRDSYARGWRAAVDGRPAPVLRANGKHRAVPVAGGTHEVVLRYHPPGLVPGLALTATSLLASLVLVARRRGGTG
jgi:hypothetical protein